MKRLLVTVGLSLTVLSGYAQATKTDRGPETPRTPARGITTASPGETVKILLACINQPGFEKYYAANGTGSVNVIGLPTGDQLPAKAAALGRSLRLQSADQMTAGTLTNYFSVGSVTNADNHVNVSLTYFYNHSKEGYKVVMVDMELVKSGDKYQIVNANFNGDLL